MEVGRENTVLARCPMVDNHIPYFLTVNNVVGRITLHEGVRGRTNQMRFGRVSGIVAMLLMVLTGALAAPVAAATTYSDPQQRFSFTVPDG